MSFKITEDCINCAACEPECPNQAIREGDNIFIINPEKCTECVGLFTSSRCAEVCPVDVCVTDPKYPETKEQLLAKWRKLHPGETPAAGTF
ncbi:MAG: YfhL family 4Fe-4S dicluster ferredoxin [Dehalococcoidia bacterium]|nr:YfhL family 4Fe-4S dicluster ferredoxin [Dehalococcoidia bacterium]